MPSYLQGFVGNLTNLLNQIPGAAISASPRRNRFDMRRAGVSDA